MRTLTEVQKIERSIHKKFRRELWRKFIRGVQQYELIQPDDKIAVCISGGKDSFLLAKLLQQLHRMSEIPFSLDFIVMNPGYDAKSFAKILENADLLQVPVQVFDSDIFEIVLKSAPSAQWEPGTRGEVDTFPRSREQFPHPLKGAPSARWEPGTRGEVDTFPRSREQFPHPLKSAPSARWEPGTRGEVDTFPRSRKPFPHPQKSAPSAQWEPGTRGEVDTFPRSREPFPHPQKSAPSAQWEPGTRGEVDTFPRSREQFPRPQKSGGSPCYLCARMRRGFLYATAQNLGYNKIALGHHMSDVVETTLMGMLYGAQNQTMMPKLKSRNFAGMQLIRPMYCIEESAVLAWKNYNALDFISCGCPLATHCDEGNISARAAVKSLLADMKKSNKDVEKNVFNALQCINLETTIAYKKTDASTVFLMISKKPATMQRKCVCSSGDRATAS